MLPAKEIDTLLLLAHYFTLTRAQINRLVFPNDASGRATRKHLQRLWNLDLINRCRMEVVNPVMGAPAPVYYPSKGGCAYLAQELEDDRFKSVCTQTPNPAHLYHWVAVADTHILLDQAAKVAGATVVEWVGEWDVANESEKQPDKRYRLYTRLSDKLVCVPDAAWVLDRNGQRRVFYLEQDRNTTKSADQFAARKCGGYAGLFAQRGHGRHFPGLGGEQFRVLVVAPDVRRRESLRKAVAHKSAHELWRFASLTDLAPETMLTTPVWYKCGADEPRPLLNVATLSHTDAGNGPELGPKSVRPGPFGGNK